MPEFEAAAFSAPRGELVKVQTPFGWHLLKVLRYGCYFYGGGSGVWMCSSTGQLG